MEELQESVNQWLDSNVTAEFDYTGIQKLVSHYEKCLNSESKYVKK